MSRVRQLHHKNVFENEYLMSYATHCNLVQILHPFLKRKEYNSHGHQPIMVEHIIAMGLCILSGCCPKDQRHIITICPDAAYKDFNVFLDAVNQAPKLAIETPQSAKQWDSLY